MTNIKRILMIISLVCMIICFGASMYFTFALQGNDADATFYIMDVLFLVVIIWFISNLKQPKKES